MRCYAVVAYPGHRGGLKATSVEHLTPGQVLVGDTVVTLGLLAPHGTYAAHVTGRDVTLTCQKPL